MAREVQIWGAGRSGVPDHYRQIKPGNAFMTRYVKEHSEIIYILMARSGRGQHQHFRVVGYLAPEHVLQNAQLHWERHAASLRRRAQATERLQLLGTAGDVVRDVFLTLEPPVLKKVLSEYRRTFGDKKYEYAKRAYEKWKTSTAQMSVALRQRLLSFLPLYLSFEQKYAIVEAIWRRSGTLGSHHFVIDSAQGIEACLKAITISLRATLKQSIPGNVRETLTWLSDADSQLSEALAREFFEREIPIIVSTHRDKLETALKFVGENPGAANAQVKLEAPSVQVIITITGRHQVSSQGNDHGSLVPIDRDKMYSTPAKAVDPSGQLPEPIEHPQDLLGEALRRLPPEKTKEILSKAADKALDLQIKLKEAQIDNAILGEQLDTVTEAARRHKEAGTNFGYENDTRSEHGSTRVTVSVGPEKPRVQAGGSCFVATSCYGDPAHPTVVALQSFRDAVLMRTARGRGFVAMYYAHGPMLAKALDVLPFLKPPLRGALTKVAALLQKQSRSSAPQAYRACPTHSDSRDNATVKIERRSYIGEDNPWENGR